jgi:PAS domain S-box-containing protein
MSGKKVSDGACIRILHVDDDVDLLDVSKKILSLEGYFEIDAATTIDEALKKMRVTHYDAVISDYELPQRNGLDFLMELRKQKNNIPFILFTGRGREEIAIKALNLGADGYVNKQGNPETVYGELSHILKSAVSHNQVEEKVHESEEKYQTSFESSLDAIVLIGRDGFFDCNSSTLKLFKCKSISGFIKKHPKDWCPPFQPDGSPSSEEATRHIKKAFETGTDHFFFVHQRSDGTTFPADVLLTLIRIKGETVLQATIRDVTEQKQSEQQLKYDQERIALMNEKLRFVGSLTRHDVRNKLSAIPAYSYLLKKKYDNQADLVEGLNKIEASVKEAEKIFEHARSYEQLGVEKLVYMDVEKTIKEAFDLFSSLNIELINGCHGLELLADSFLRQLFYNFIENTLKHGKKATKISIYFEKLQNVEVRLVCEDDGVGITSEDKKCVFKQGFSKGGGSGFGLFLIKNMIDVYGWSIKENGVPEIGAKFEITIPKLNKAQQINYHIHD